MDIGVFYRGVLVAFYLIQRQDKRYVKADSADVLVM